MDRLTFELIAAHHPRRIVIDYDDDHWHAGCLAAHTAQFYIHGVRRGPNTFPTSSDGSNDKCWYCSKTDAEPWTS